MTGIWPPKVRTADIWRRTRKVSRMLLPLNSLKLSAQSPPWRRKARPMAASARRSSRCLASPANTIGGNASIVLSTASSSAALGYSGSCSAFFVLQLSTAHLAGATCFVAAGAGATGAGAAATGAFSGAATDGDDVFAADGTPTGGFFDGSAACTARTAVARRFIVTN
ncbi:Os03g0389601, partial [Oryza sativa Japonica Group]